MNMEITIINAEQTPKTNFIKSPKRWCEDNKELIEKLFEFAKSKTTAIGLASNQLAIDGVHIMDRFCLIRDFQKETEETGPIWDLAINPEIILTKGVQDLRYENCLTWPGMTISVLRYRYIQLRLVLYSKLSQGYFEPIETKFKSHIWQHEINHLDGIEENLIPSNFNSQPKQTSTDRNLPCLCGSGIKYKKCCGLYEIN